MFSPITLVGNPAHFTPPVVLQIVPHGLTVHKILVNPDGESHDLVVGPENPADFQKYQATVVGRTSNRLPVDTLHVERNGIQSSFTTLPNESASVSLHGGPEGFDAQVWDKISADKASLFSPAEIKEINALGDDSAALFTLTSPDGDQGFPGALVVQVLFAVLPSSSNVPDQVKGAELGNILIVYRANLLPKEGTKVTSPVNLTQHWGFNLDASLRKGEGSVADIKDHSLFIKAASTQELDKNALFTGNLIPVAGTEHDHAPKRIGDRFPNPGYDSFYVFSPPTIARQPTRLPLAKLETTNLLKDLVTANKELDSDPLVELSSAKSGFKLSFDSNQSGVQFYSGNFMPGTGSRKRIHGGTGSTEGGNGYTKSTAAYLEFHEPLVSWMFPSTSKITDSLLTSDELYHNYVKLKISWKAPYKITNPLEWET